jgi:hypothetical protein
VFQRTASDLLGAEVVVFSDGALRNYHVSPDRPSKGCSAAARHRAAARHLGRRVERYQVIGGRLQRAGFTVYAPPNLLRALSSDATN